MTRRIIKPQPGVFEIDGKPASVTLMHVDGDPWPRVTVGRVITRQEVRFVPGMRLWAKETFAGYWDDDVGLRNDDMIRLSTGQWVIYRADHPDGADTWTPSIYMPRDASRLTLVVTATKIERLQDISEKDAAAEGADRDHSTKWPDGDPGTIADVRRRDFAAIWQGINGTNAWYENPYVVALSFEVHCANIDNMPRAAA